MARPPKLNWEPARGKWKVEYRGKKYRFEGGTGKSDRAAKKAAEEEWKKLKAKVDHDAQLVRPHQEQYEQAVQDWECVLAWAARHGDTDTSQTAANKLEDLRKRLAAPRLKPLATEDLFEGQFQLSADLGVDQVLDLALGSREPPKAEDFAHLARLGGLRTGDPERRAVIAAEMDGTPIRIAREIWRDRLESQRRVAPPQKGSLHVHVARFLKKKGGEVQAGELSTGRLYKLQLHLGHFEEWLGQNTAVTEIDGLAIEDYRAELLTKVATKQWTKTTASDRLNDVRAFVRWLWRTEAIQVLPRNLDDPSLCISTPPAEVIEFTIDEVTTLLKEASERTKLFILLTLNTGMTQKDISDLAVTEVAWDDGRIVRKRSKTRGYETVPTVNYLLWPETLRLLQRQRANSDDGRVLLNANGTPLWNELISEKGSYKKSDNVRNAFERLRRKTGIDKPFKSLKKTSATLLRGNRSYMGLEDLFLGHAPERMSDKHYAGVPQNLLDEALDWLRGQYRLDEMMDVFQPKVPKPERRPRKPRKAKAHLGGDAAPH